MFLKVGGEIRSIAEVKTAPQYKLFYAGNRSLYKLGVTITIDGRIVLQDNATQTQMTAEINRLTRALSTPRPDVVLLNDDGVTPSAFAFYANQCIDGPNLQELSFSTSDSSVYSASQPYTATYYAESLVTTGSQIVEFKEMIDCDPGGEERVMVGGAVNLPERQIGRQYAPWKYTQQGTAVGLFAYPEVPPPLWPGFLVKDEPRVMDESPDTQGPIPMNFRRSWVYQYESPFKLYGAPHFL